MKGNVPLEYHALKVLETPEYDTLKALREVWLILKSHEKTKKGLRRQRAKALLTIIDVLGYHDALKVKRENEEEVTPSPSPDIYNEEGES